MQFFHRDTTPRLEKLQVDFFNPLTFSVQRLLQFVSTTENLSVKRAKFEFGDEDIAVKVYPQDEAKTYALSMVVDSYHLDWQVSSAAQISDSLSPTFSAVESVEISLLDTAYIVNHPKSTMRLTPPSGTIFSSHLGT